jgi:hypothetical protein
MFKTVNFHLKVTLTYCLDDWPSRVETCDFKCKKEGACPQKHGAISYLIISPIYVNLWKRASDISHRRLGTLVKFLVQTERAQVSVVYCLLLSSSMLLLCSASCCDWSIVNFASLEFGVIIDYWACISSYLGFCVHYKI